MAHVLRHDDIRAVIHVGTSQRLRRLARQSTPTPSIKKPRATVFEGSVDTEHPPRLDDSVVGGGVGVVAALGAVEATAAGGGTVAEGVGTASAEGAALAAEAGGRGIEAEWQRKWALNLKRKWLRSSSTHVPFSKRCFMSSMMAFVHGSPAFLSRQSCTPSPPNGTRSAWARLARKRMFNAVKTRRGACLIMVMVEK